MLEELQKGSYRIVFSRHAFSKAMKRGIHPDIIEDCIQHGRIIRFGRKRIKIIKEFREIFVICVDEIIGNTIKIVTIAKKAKK
jgi:hypothetical protein